MFHPNLKLGIGKTQLSVSCFWNLLFVCFLSYMVWLSSKPEPWASCCCLCFTSPVPSPAGSSSQIALSPVLFFPFPSVLCCQFPEPLACLSSFHYYSLLDFRGVFFFSFYKIQTCLCHAFALSSSKSPMSSRSTIHSTAGKAFCNPAVPMPVVSPPHLPILSLML